MNEELFTVYKITMTAGVFPLVRYFRVYPQQLADIVKNISDLECGLGIETMYVTCDKSVELVQTTWHLEGDWILTSGTSLKMMQDKIDELKSRVAELES